MITKKERERLRKLFLDSCRKARHKINQQYRPIDGSKPYEDTYVYDHVAGNIGQNKTLSAPNDKITLGTQYLWTQDQASRVFRSPAMVKPPTVRNQCKCILPRHGLISYLQDVKLYESALGAEYQQEDDDEIDAAHNLLYLKMFHRELFEI